MDVSAPTARNMTHTTLPDPQNRITGKADVQDAVLHQAADAFETHFLAEMLKSAGLGQARESFGGGVGEEQFGSFLVQAQAERMVSAGGIGLSEQVFEVLKGRNNAAKCFHGRRHATVRIADGRAAIHS